MPDDTKGPVTYNTDVPDRVDPDQLIKVAARKDDKSTTKNKK